MDNKLMIFAAVTLVAAGAQAIVFTKPTTVRPAFRGPTVIHTSSYGWDGFGTFRTEFRHVPLSDPNDPFHDTYRKNLGGSAAKTTTSESKDSALDRRIKDLEKQLSDLQEKMANSEATKERKSPISVYSNISAPKAKTASKQINIRDSYVTIYTD